jgi:hypothetical protein
VSAVVMSPEPISSARADSTSDFSRIASKPKLRNCSGLLIEFLCSG